MAGKNIGHFQGELLLRSLHIDSLIDEGLDLVLGADDEFVYMCDWFYGNRHWQNLQRIARHFGLSPKELVSNYGVSNFEKSTSKKQIKAYLDNYSNKSDSYSNQEALSPEFISKTGKGAIPKRYSKYLNYSKGESQILDRTVEQLQQYLRGERDKFDLPVKPIGTVFQLRVWERLTSIAFGSTTTYGQIAQDLGLHRGYQALGSAVGLNPISIIIPCHRVLSHCGLGGYAGGAQIKKALLSLETGKGALFEV